MQWLQDPNQRNVDNLNNVTREASKHFSGEGKENLKTKTDEHETKRKIKNTRDSYTCIMTLRRVTSLEII
jgi:hypothetical protein